MWLQAYDRFDTVYVWGENPTRHTTENDMTYNPNLNSHPLTIERYRGWWATDLKRDTRTIGRELALLGQLVADPAALRENVQVIAYRAARILALEESIDKTQRLLDGRPTREEESIAASRELEARWNAEAAREHSGGWADDEFNARHDDVRERFSGFRS